MYTFLLPLGEDTQEGNRVQHIGTNESVALSYPESSLKDGEQSFNSLDIPRITSVLPPPPPSFFLGYTLPPGHPCNSFTLPPPPADKKRTGPRRKLYFPSIVIPDFSFGVLCFHEIFCRWYIKSAYKHLSSRWQG